MANKMKLTSKAFEQGKSIPSNYTCDGENISPPLKIENVPETAKSLVLIMDDPDVPKNLRADGMWDHWVVFDIPTNTNEIAEGKEPKGTHGMGTAKNTGYYGPCPPDKEHRYFFKLYALDKQLGLPEKSTKKDVEQAMEGHILDKTELMGVYDRQR